MIAPTATPDAPWSYIALVAVVIVALVVVAGAAGGWRE